MSDVQVVVTESPVLSVTVEEAPDSSIALDIGPPPAAVEVQAPEEVGVDVTEGSDLTVAVSAGPIATVEVNPTGTIGPPGPQGPASSDKYYVHTQDTPSAIWEYGHGLGKYPGVVTYGTDNVRVEGDVTYPDIDHVRIEYSGPMSGTAYNN